MILSESRFEFRRRPQHSSRLRGELFIKAYVEMFQHLRVFFTSAADRALPVRNLFTNSLTLVYRT